MTEPYLVAMQPRPNVRRQSQCCAECCYEIAWPPIQPRPVACPYCYADWTVKPSLREALTDWWRTNITPHAHPLAFYLMYGISALLMLLSVVRFFITQS